MPSRSRSLAPQEGEKSMSDWTQLEGYEDRWETKVGAWFPGERVLFRDKDLFGEFSHRPWMRLLLFGITGREFTDAQVRLFEACWNIATSFPDPRIWNNRVTSLAATARSTAALAIGAATSVSEASIYGRGPDIRAIRFLIETQHAIDAGGSLEELVEEQVRAERGLPGFGRPVINRDERIAPIMEIARELGLASGPHTKLAFEIEDVLLRRRWRFRINVAALVAGLAADQGLSPQEYYCYTVLSFSAGFFPCYLEALENPPGAFLPLRVERVHFTGSMRRKW